MWVSVIVLKMPIGRLQDQARASIFTDQKFISLKIMAHSLFQIRAVFAKYLKLTL